MLIQIKAFIKPYIGASFEAFQDRISINPEKLRFALADGVTQSYMPGQWAEALVESFVFSDKSHTDWVSSLQSGMLSLLTKEWEEKEKNRLSYSEESRLRAYKRSSVRFNHTAASTFAGCYFQDNQLHYAVIGDSCIFVIEKGEIKNILSTVGNDGFSNTTSAIFSTGAIDGRFSTGVIDLTPGFVMLMSDALADWFSRQNNVMEIIGDLWKINNHSEFDSYIDKIHESHSISNDDISVILIRVDIGDKTEVLAFDHLESFLTLDNKEQSSVPETIMHDKELHDGIDGIEQNEGDKKPEPISMADEITQEDAICEEKQVNEEAPSFPETDTTNSSVSFCNGNNDSVSTADIHVGTVPVIVPKITNAQLNNGFEASTEEGPQNSVYPEVSIEQIDDAPTQPGKARDASSFISAVNSDDYDSSNRIESELITHSDSRKNSLWDLIKGLFK